METSDEVKHELNNLKMQISLCKGNWTSLQELKIEKARAGLDNAHVLLKRGLALCGNASNNLQHHAPDFELLSELLETLQGTIQDIHSAHGVCEKSSEQIQKLNASGQVQLSELANALLNNQEQLGATEVQIGKPVKKRKKTACTDQCGGCTSGPSGGQV